MARPGRKGDVLLRGRSSQGRHRRGGSFLVLGVPVFGFLPRRLLTVRVDTVTSLAPRRRDRGVGVTGIARLLPRPQPGHPVDRGLEPARPRPPGLPAGGLNGGGEREGRGESHGGGHAPDAHLSHLFLLFRRPAGRRHGATARGRNVLPLPRLVWHAAAGFIARFSVCSPIWRPPASRSPHVCRNALSVIL